MRRRNFIQQVGLSSGACLGASLFPAFGEEASKSFPESGNMKKISQIEKPLAIAMWDFSWILRHHHYGEFADWEKTVSELAERGYNAVRIDAMPHYVAAEKDGTVIEEFRSVRHDWIPVKWGNYYSMDFRPREALLKFLPLCKKYGIKVALSTWFIAHGGDRWVFNEKGGLLRAWTETLNFLDGNDLLDDNIIYIDLLNEYPFWHGYQWLKEEIDSRNALKFFDRSNPNANIPDNQMSVRGMNDEQRSFYNKFANDHLKTLKAKFPKEEFTFCFNYQMDLDLIDLERFELLDCHNWFADLGKIPYLDELGNLDQAEDNKAYFLELMQVWDSQKKELTPQLDQRIRKVSEVSEKLGIPCGNTEGWGPIFWLDHPDIDWKWVKEAGEIAVGLCLKYENYKFICTSNFTHPQFKGMWEDVAWHKRITDKIKSGKN